MKNKKAKTIEEPAEPLGTHLERLGQIEVHDADCLAALKEAMEVSQKAYSAFFYSIAQRYHLPEDREWVIFPNGKVSVYPKGKP